MPSGISSPLCIPPPNVALAQKLPTSTPASVADRNTVAAFITRAKAYVKLRNGVESKLQKLSKDSTPEQITSHKKALEEGVRAARAGAKPGDTFHGRLWRVLTQDDPKRVQGTGPW